MDGLAVAVVVLGTVAALLAWALTVTWQRSRALEREAKVQRERREGFAVAVARLIHGD